MRRHITDIVPQTVYDTVWGTDTSAATRSAAEIFLENQGVELLYAQRDWEPSDIDLYNIDEINPRAGESGSGFSALRDSAGECREKHTDTPQLADRQNYDQLLEFVRS